LAAPTKTPPRENPVKSQANLQPRRGNMQLSDHFVEFSSKLVNKVIEWRIPVVLSVVGIFVVAGIASLFNGYRQRQNEEATAEIYKITSRLSENDQNLEQLGVDLDDIGRTPEEMEERKAKYLAAAVSLQEIATKYPSVAGGTVARLERADLLSKAGKTDEAATAYQETLSSGVKEPLFRYRALSGLASTLIAQGKSGEAIQRYQSVISEMDGLWKQLAMLEMGRTYELMKDFANATKTYEQFLKDFPGAPQSEDVQARLAVAKAGGPATRAPAAVSNPEGNPVSGDAGSIVPSAGEPAPTGVDAAPAVQAPAEGAAVPAPSSAPPSTEPTNEGGTK